MTRIDLPTTPGRSANMRANRRKDTQPELRVRRMLHARGLRYRVDLPIRVPGAGLVRPDIVFTRAKLAVFIDGCFWHGCPEHGTRPRSNAGYWLPKLEANAARDIRQASALESCGWVVVRFWEHQPLDEVVEQIELRYRESVRQTISRRSTL